MFDTALELAGGVGQWRTSYKLALQDVELRYKRSLLGPFWISASLVATVLALAYVFSAVLDHGLSDYIAYLGAGMLTWQLIVSLINEAAGSVVEHGSMMQSVRLPLTVVAGRIALRNAIYFVHNLMAIAGLMLIMGSSFSFGALMALPGALTILAIGYFLTILLGPICARYRDLPMIIASVMQVLFFLTPIIWMESSVTNRPMFAKANPFYHLVELVRAPMLGDAATRLNWDVALWSAAVVAVSSLVAAVVVRKRVALWI